MATTQPFENPAAAVDAGSVDSLAWVYDQVARCAYALKEAAPHLANEAWTLCGHVNSLRADRAAR